MKADIQFSFIEARVFVGESLKVFVRAKVRYHSLEFEGAIIPEPRGGSIGISKQWVDHTELAVVQPASGQI
jgi:hypothetical protein